MTGTALQDLNRQRRPAFAKPAGEEGFLLEMNQLLAAQEVASYQSVSEEHPFLFVFGLPRSGTTVLTQLIAHCFDVGYINNLVARFWLAPLTGIRLSGLLLKEKRTTYESSYATTQHLSDIHEFGYFWRHWLKKEKSSDFVDAEQKERDIDWTGLRTVLLNIQHQFGKAVVFKNIYGAYHLRRMHDLLHKALFIYIERDPVDNAIAILMARRQFYADANLWWSTVPVEYERLKDLPYMEQIGGQVYYLRRYYKQQMEAIQSRRFVRVPYQALCQDPSAILQEIQQCCVEQFGIRLRPDALPPPSLEFRHHREQTDLGDQFREIMAKLKGRPDRSA